MMEALWLHQYHNVVDEDLLKRMLRSPDFHARAAATRVLCYWRDRVKDPLDFAARPDQRPTSAGPPGSDSGLELLPRAKKPSAVAVELLASPTDKYLNFTFNETLNTLERRLSTGQARPRQHRGDAC